MSFHLIAAGVILLIVALVVLIYNGLVVVKNRVDNAWSQIDVQLKKRYDLVPNLVSTVQGYVKHERETLETITKARAAMVNAGSVKETADASNMLTGALKSLFAVAENYPDLKANQNFLMLQEELSGIENKIAYSRQAYNDSVLDYNNKIQTVPSNFVAGMFSFKQKDYFEVPQGEKEVVKVKF